MSWLIITKQEYEDEKKWGLDGESFYLIVNKDGRVTKRCIDLTIKPEQLPPVFAIVINFSNFPAADTSSAGEQRKILLSEITSLIGNDEVKIWVHFGGVLSGDLINKPTKIGCAWKNPEYSSLREMFPLSIPFPYSQTSNMPWDQALQEVTLAVSNSIKTRHPVEIVQWTQALTGAWQKAEGKYAIEEIQEEINSPGLFNVVKTLLPVFICFDALAYAEENSRMEEVKRCVMAEVPTILNGIGAEKLEELAQKLKMPKMDGLCDDNLASLSSEFVTWYRIQQQKTC